MKADRRIHDIEQGRNLRYFGFLIIAILAGGKLANASRAMFKVDPGRPRSWTVCTVKYAIRLGVRLLRHVSKLAGHTWHFAIRYAAERFARKNDCAATGVDEQDETASMQDKS
jgi:hypothetical protein